MLVELASFNSTEVCCQEILLRYRQKFASMMFCGLPEWDTLINPKHVRVGRFNMDSYSGAEGLDNGEPDPEPVRAMVH
jgi:hypothetical protein